LESVRGSDYENAVLWDLTSRSRIEICRSFVPPLSWFKNVELGLFGKDNKITFFFQKSINLVEYCDSENGGLMSMVIKRLGRIQRMDQARPTRSY
jgi:hypothetical protein